MRRVSRVVLAGAIAMAPVVFFGQSAVAQQQSSATTFDGDVALWTVQVNPGQTAAYEAVMAQLKTALMKSDKPERRRQAAGWKIMRGQTTPQGQVMYINILDPVVRGADYNPLNIIYEVVTEHEEKTRIYEQYRAALGGQSAVSGRVTMDMAR